MFENWMIQKDWIRHAVKSGYVMMFAAVLRQEPGETWYSRQGRDSRRSRKPVSPGRRRLVWRL